VFFGELRGFFHGAVGEVFRNRRGGGDQNCVLVHFVHVFICSLDLSWFKASVFPLNLRAKASFFNCFLLVISNNLLYYRRRGWKATKRRKIKIPKK
jgi:hypothetical protein